MFNYLFELIKIVNTIFKAYRWRLGWKYFIDIVSICLERLFISLQYAYFSLSSAFLMYSRNLMHDIVKQPKIDTGLSKARQRSM